GARQLGILLGLQLLEQVGVSCGGGREAAARPPQAIRANARIVDERSRQPEVLWTADQRLRPNQVVLGREHERAVQRPRGQSALWIVAAPGEAVVADLSNGALVPRPARLVSKLLAFHPDVVVSGPPHGVRVRV